MQVRIMELIQQGDSHVENQVIGQIKQTKKQEMQMHCSSL